MLTRNWTLFEANALAPFIAEHLTALREAVVQARAHDDAGDDDDAPAVAAGDAGAATAASAEKRPSERPELQALAAEALQELARVGASVRLDPLGVEVAALRAGQPVRLVLVEGRDTFTLWRDLAGGLHTVDNDDAELFGAPVLQ